MTKDKTTEETVEIKCNHLFMPVIYYLQTTLSIERICKDTLWSYSED